MVRGYDDPTALPPGDEFLAALRRERALMSREQTVAVIRQAVRDSGARFITPWPCTTCLHLDLRGGSACMHCGTPLPPGRPGPR